MINMKSPILRPYKPTLLAGLLLARMPRLAREIDFTSERVPDGSGNALCRIAPKTRQGNNPKFVLAEGKSKNTKPSVYWTLILSEQPYAAHFESHGRARLY